MTSRAILPALAIGVCAVASVSFVAAQQRGPEAFVARAAAALGGAARLRAVKTIAVAGYGEAA